MTRLRFVDAILDRLDPPRFCPVDGQPIRVDEHERFHPKTGSRRTTWTWRCPDVRLTVDGDGTVTRAAQTGYLIHPYGHGRPRWHASERAA